MKILSGIVQTTSSILPIFLLLTAGSLSAIDHSGSTSKNTAAGSAVHSTVSDTLTVVARLVEIPGKFPPNDLYNYVYIMKYRILKVERGTFRGPEIFIGHYNPLISRQLIRDKMDSFVDGDVTSFTTGDRHRLTLVTPIESVWNDAVEDEYVDSEAEKWFALRCDKTE